MTDLGYTRHAEMRMQQRGIILGQAREFVG